MERLLSGCQVSPTLPLLRGTRGSGRPVEKSSVSVYVYAKEATRLGRISTSPSASTPRERARPALTGPPKGAVGRGVQHTIFVGEIGVEIGRPEPDAVSPQILVHADVPRLAPLGLERRVAELREEEIVEGRRAETRAGAPTQARAGLLDDEED